MNSLKSEEDRTNEDRFNTEEAKATNNNKIVPSNKLESETV